jgi:hypothetical protein
MPGQYKYRWDLVAQTTQFEQNMSRAADRAKKLGENTQKATGEIAKLSQGAGQGGAAIEKLSSESGKMGEKVSSVMSSVGGSIGGFKGEVISLIGELTAVTGPMALIAAGVGGIALAWSHANEQIEKYLESVDKGKYNPAIFSTDSKKAYSETKDIAAGGMYAGANLAHEARRKLSLGQFETEEQKKQLELQVELGEQMIKDNKTLQESLGIGTKIVRDKVVELAWIQKRNNLLKDADELDKEKIRNQTEINGLEGDLTQIKTKIFQSGDEKEKAKLLVDYDKTAAQIRDKKVSLLEKEERIKSELYKMAGQTEELEMLGLQTAEKKSEVNQAYLADQFQMQRLINKVAKGSNLASVKEFNTADSGGYNFGTDLTNVNGTKSAGSANVGQLLKGISLHPQGLITQEQLTILAKYNGLSKDQIANIVKTNTELEREQEIADGLTGVFMDMFSSIDGGFEEMAKSLIKSIEQIAIKLAAQAAAFALISILFPGGGIAAGGIGKFLGLSGLIPGLAEGGLAYGPTIAQVGEYGNAKSNPEVIAPLSKLQAMLQPAQGMNGVVRFEIGNRVITGVLEQENRISRNIRGR